MNILSMQENNYLTELLRNRKLKVTSKRLEVLGVIREHSSAISYSALQASLHDFDRVTLYRTIHSLIENGIIHKALTEENETFYALCSTTCTSASHIHKHIHFKCVECNGVTCVESVHPIQLSIVGYSIENVEVEARGRCAACKN